MILTFEAVISRDFELEYKIPENVGQRYEELTSFNRGRDFNRELNEYIIDFVDMFKEYLSEENEARLNERLVKYNKLVVDLRTRILSATTVPSVMICGGGNYPVRKKEKELERIHGLEAELYSNRGKHAKFIENTRKMFNPVLIENREQLELKRKATADEKGWTDFYKEVEHDEIAGYGIDLDANRIYIETHGKPSDEMRQVLKDAALKWSPRNVRWQRILTENAVRAINNKVLNPFGLDLMNL